MPSQYYIPPSLQSLTWADGQSPFDSQNYKKYIYNDDGNLIWKSPSSFSMDQFAPDMRVRYVFWASTTYTNLSGSTFTQIKDSTANSRHAVNFANVSYITNATAPLGGLQITSGSPYIRLPTTILPPSPSTKYFMCFVVNFSLFTSGGAVWYAAQGGYNYFRINADGISGDARMSNVPANNITYNNFGSLNSSYKTKFCIVIIENTGTNTKVWINGVLVGSDTFTQTYGFGADDITLFNLSYPSAGNGFSMVNGILDEFFVIEGASCTDANRQKIEGLYAWRHRFETYLAAGHPHINAAP